MSDNTLGRERAPLLKHFIFIDPVRDGDFISPRRSAAAERYLAGRARRVLDVLAASGVLVFLAPLMVLIAVAVYMSSPGPILFRQKRHGQGMAMFEMLKFRSMYCDQQPDPDVKQATRHDPRVTPLGRLLRRTSLDELPQLWNVIRGDMSLIGPRPHAVEHDNFYRDLIPTYCERFRVRPGITGLAQVNGARGATPQVEDMADRVQLDLLYMQKASFFLDCRILLRTVKEVIGSDSAF